jgi:type VI secretion system protein ImpJ
MTWKSKVVWFEGMYLRPQHFQQQERYLESIIQGRCGYIQPFDWGFAHLSLDKEALALGQVAIAEAEGRLPDGTPFDIPHQDEPPKPIEVDLETRNALVFLILPLRQAEKPDVVRGDVSDTRGRYRSIERETRDDIIGSENLELIEVGHRQLRLVIEGKDTAGLAALGIARVAERMSNNSVRLDENYIPPCVDCCASKRLGGFLKEMRGSIRQAAEDQAEWVGKAGRLSEHDIADFLYLQVLNRYERLFEHVSRIRGFHPEDFYRLGLQFAGELSTLAAPGRRPTTAPLYQHHDLQTTFSPLMEEFRQYVPWGRIRPVVEIILEETEHDVFVGRSDDYKLLKNSQFVLALKADVPPETLRIGIPERLKIGAMNRIARLVNDRLPGVGLRPLQNIPQQLPPYTDCTYFELEQYGSEWQEITKSGTFAFYVHGQFPGLKMFFWAIKGTSSDAR